MLFQNEAVSLKLEIVSYEFSSSAGASTEDRNWLVLRATYTHDDGRVIRESSSCLSTGELQALAAGLKVLRSGIRDRWDSEFIEPVFLFSAYKDEEERYRANVSFILQNTMEDIDCADVDCVMNEAGLSALIAELDGLCKKFPQRN
ncbi:hypothetical protein [Oscillibacter sp.]|uniref:WapI family immunity protein n=1 Tax=Oscillibacter sp. TaxID=1945593 RepID=UPI0028A6189B|nr:hypothetical protein [Oscillibacter sp.]